MIAPTFAGTMLAAMAILCFVGLLFIGSRLLPGRLEAGAPRPEGGVLRYRLNGLFLFLLTVAAAGLAELAGWRLGRLIEQFWNLLIAANALAFLLSFLLVWTGRKVRPPGLASFWYGAVRDPSLFGIDLKLFSYRPSLIGLMLICIGCAAYQLETSGGVTLAMGLWLLMVGLYLFNYFQFEHGMLFTWDIIEERFGWMLVWGDYVLVPFFYGLPGLVLAMTGGDASLPLAIACTALYLFGFWLFRGANQQKHAFRRDRSAAIWGRPARTIGDRLLVSGFWGIGRKLNYTGEICIYLAWTIPAALASPVALLLPFWLISLLVHRAARDDRRCRAKYGPLWEEYCRAARFRMIPFLY
jgi:Delta14-sterol reductase